MNSVKAETVTRKIAAVKIRLKLSSELERKRKNIMVERMLNAVRIPQYRHSRFVYPYIFTPQSRFFAII